MRSILSTDENLIEEENGRTDYLDSVRLAERMQQQDDFSAGVETETETEIATSVIMDLLWAVMCRLTDPNAWRMGDHYPVLLIH